jgi:hypothetical protein
MKLASFTIVAIGALLFTCPAAHAAAKSCLGSDPSVATDPTQIAAVRASIATMCPCSSFDGSKGLKHGDYVKCAKGEIAAAVTTAQLRTQCKGTVTTYYSVSTCGLPAGPPAAPCLTKNTKGVVKCAIKPTAKCKGTVCSAFTACIDAADTNADGLINQSDSGSCNVSGPAPIQFTASLDAAQAGTASTATGSCTGTLNAAQTSFSIMCTHNVAGAFAAHIHSGAPGVAGPIVFPFSSPSSPINETWSTITPSDVTTLLAGGDYVNIHSSNCMICPGGEIRGQLTQVP